MKSTISVRVDRDIRRLLARVEKASGRSRSDIVRDALRRQLTIDFLGQMRRRIAPFAEARGLLTDEEIFKLVS